MKFHKVNGVRFFTFGIFPKEVIHAIFTRQGGMSPEPWTSLNVGGTVGDEHERVRENRYRCFSAIGRDRRSMFDVWQIHSADIVIVNSAHPDISYPPEFKADGMVTDNPTVSLFMRFADCTPIMLYDPKKKAVGIVHAGWQGTVKGAVGQAVQTLQAAYGSNPGDILAAIGPAIGPDHYEVGADVIDLVHLFFGKQAVSLLHEHNGRTHFDLWAANKLTLQQAGVWQVEIAGLCTACHQEDWYSHRAQNGKTGRFGALISLA